MDFQHVQEAKMLVNGVAAENNCEVVSNKIMICESPPADLSTSGHRSRRQADDTSLPLTFYFDGFVPELSDEFGFTVYPDPLYYLFSIETVYETLVVDGIYKLDKESTLIQLMGSDIDLASDVNDVQVFIGNMECSVLSLTDTTVVADIPDEEPDPVDGGDHPHVVIHHGNLQVTFGLISYPGSSTTVIIVIITCAVIILIIFTAGFLCWYRSRLIAKQMNDATVKFFAEQVDDQKEINTTVIDLETDYMDMVDIAKQGIVECFQSKGHYIQSMLFLGCTMIPQSVEESEYTPLLKQGQQDLVELLLDEKLLLKLVEILDNDPSVTRLHRQNFAALFLMATIVDNKTEYLLEILEMLLSRHIEDNVKSKKRKLVLNRTGTVVEYLLSHWMALCMYTYTMKHASRPLYQLIEAIKTRVESGAVDVVHHHCQYSLHENFLLSIAVTGEDIYLKLVVDEETVKQELVMVKSCDTLLQVKAKLLNVMFKEQPFPSRPQATQVKLEWRVSREECIVLEDTNDYEQDPQTKKKKVPTATLR